MIGLSIVGGLWGYVTSLSTTNRYEVRAAFLMPSEDAAAEYERLLSRKLVSVATARFRVSRWVDKGNRGLYEMYSESPFVIRPIVLAPDLQDIGHRLRLVSDGELEIEVQNGNEVQKYKGTFGEPIRGNGFIVVVNQTRSFSASDLAAHYVFAFNSEAAVATRFLSNLNVVHVLDHPNRIGLIYTDEHPALAYDLLDAFTQAYLEEYHRQRMDLFIERLREVNAEMKVLENQILGLRDPAPFLRDIATVGSQLAVGDSATARLLQHKLQAQFLESRIQAWEAFALGNRDSVAWKQLLGQWMPSPAENGLLEVRDVDTLIARDQRQLEGLRTQELDLQSRYLSAISFQRTWEKEWLSTEEPSYGMELLLRKKYLAALEESAKIELEMRKDNHGPQLIDPPYHVKTLGRTLRIKVLVATVLGMMLLGMMIAVVLSMLARRFRSSAHFVAMGNEPARQLWRLKKDALARRSRVAKMELAWGASQRCIAFVSSLDEPNLLSSEIAASLAAYGLQVALVNGPEDVTPALYQRIALPPNAPVGWWFSAAAKNFLQELASKYERVLISLPPPHQVPEVLAALRQAHVVYYVVQKDQTKVTDWRQWQSAAKDSDIDYRAIWAD